MKLSKLKEVLNKVETINFQLSNGTAIPSHFHVTEIGKIEKHYIDCGGTERKETVINFQLWTSKDYDHRLSAEKLKSIISLSEQKLGLEDLEIEVEYQAEINNSQTRISETSSSLETIGKYALSFDGWNFVLGSKQTDCLAKEQCGVPLEKTNVKLSEIQDAISCAPGSGCC